MGLLSTAPQVRRLPGADRVLAHHEPPQPDLMCGPFAVRAAMAALVEEPALPSLAEIARAAGTRTWTTDLPEARPAGAESVRVEWAEGLPVAESEDRSGTDAGGLVAAVAALTHGDLSAVPAAGGDVGGLHHLLERLADLGPTGVVANLRTGPVLPPDAGLDVGHFVVLWGLSDSPDSPDGPRVAVADSYLELGASGLPPGCRLVPLTALHEALGGRGLLLLVPAIDEPVAAEMVRAAGLSTDVWDG